MKCPECGKELYYDSDAETEYPFTEYNWFRCDGCDYACDAVFNKSINQYVPGEQLY